ncbi:hypothetical protein GCM10007877_10740 [Marinibactrum halimedae]|uniref:1-phosphatidylinositol phosphodiesterase n=2 Tax=Marinibactrum halimedae TaxID=1444977 RepID=A0AA37T8K3_9GAMM|nr:hypothetical protein GCM10007877_10740 [Marinibactrum halimedae]
MSALIMLAACGGNVKDMMLSDESSRSEEEVALDKHYFQAYSNNLALSQIYMAYSHNSYGAAKENWSQMTLDDQLDSGIRIIELDIFDGDGAVAHSNGRDLQHCYSLEECIEQLSNWSMRNPGHSPVVVLLEVVDYDYNNPPAVTGGRERSFVERSAIVEEKINRILEVIEPFSESGRSVTYSDSMKSVSQLSDKFLFSVFRKYSTQFGSEVSQEHSKRNRTVSISEGLNLVENVHYQKAFVDRNLFLAPRWLERNDEEVVDQDWRGELALRLYAASIQDTTIQNTTTHQSTTTQSATSILRVVKNDDIHYKSSLIGDTDLLISNLEAQTDEDYSSGRALRVARNSRANGLGAKRWSHLARDKIISSLLQTQGWAPHCKRSGLSYQALGHCRGDLQLSKLSQ